MACSWKPNWEQTKSHFIKWWQHEGLVFNTWQAVATDNHHEASDHPGESPDINFFYTQPEWRSLWNHYLLSRQNFPADVLPVASTDIGPGSLAILMGGDAQLADDTVWFLPCMDSGIGIPAISRIVGAKSTFMTISSQTCADTPSRG